MTVLLLTTDAPATLLRFSGRLGLEAADTMVVLPAKPVGVRRVG